MANPTTASRNLTRMSATDGHVGRNHLRVPLVFANVFFAARRGLELVVEEPGKIAHLIAHRESLSIVNVAHMLRFRDVAHFGQHTRRVRILHVNALQQLTHDRFRSDRTGPRTG